MRRREPWDREALDTVRGSMSFMGAERRAGTNGSAIRGAARRSDSRVVFLSRDFLYEWVLERDRRRSVEDPTQTSVSIHRSLSANLDTTVRSGVSPILMLTLTLGLVLVLVVTVVLGIPEPGSRRVQTPANPSQRLDRHHPLMARNIQVSAHEGNRTGALQGTERSKGEI